jgi:hypothetical protein
MGTVRGSSVAIAAFFSSTGEDAGAFLSTFAGVTPSTKLSLYRFTNTLFGKLFFTSFMGFGYRKLTELIGLKK